MTALGKKQLTEAQKLGINRTGFVFTMAPPKTPEVTLATRVPERLHKRIKQHCIKHNLFNQAFIVDAIMEALKRGK